jgi:VIT1/CCC1 family predicted Fe2+/Mn2+ transporter
MRKPHFERHYSDRIGWLRAAVLGANDGIVSTASLVVGIASAGAARADILIASIAGLVAGAMSMAAGEYVSVSSQADTEHADIEREKRELATDTAAEHEELTNIYIERGLDRELATEVAEQLMAHDALAAHARDELGLSELNRSRPLQAALASAASFAIGALLPVLLSGIAPRTHTISIVSASSLGLLAALGALAAGAGGADRLRGALRVGIWGALAMLATALIGRLFGVLTS